MERNFETVMIEQCAPVLAGLKPAGLFRYETRDCADLARRVRSWNEQLDEKGLCVRVLKGCMRTHQYLVYVYRESRLRVLLAQPQVRDFLRGEGYDLPQQPDDDAPLLRQLSRRLCCEADLWATPSPMWWALSKMRAATSPAAAAGKPTATLPLPGSTSPS